MLIQCPNCSTKFNLPNNNVKEGVTLRCSLCKHAFLIEEGIVSEGSEPLTAEERSQYIKNILVQEDTKENSNKVTSNMNTMPIPQMVATKKTSPIFIILLLLVLCSIIGFVSYKMLIKPQEKIQAMEKTEQNMQEQVKDLSIKDFRQYFVSNNKKVPPFFIIEGKVKNTAKTAKAFIAVKASVFNAKGDVILEQEALAGVTLSLFQLQNMDKEEMKSVLSDPLEIAVTNANVAPQDEVPFMILFFDPPKDIAEFSVQIVSASPADEDIAIKK